MKKNSSFLNFVYFLLAIPLLIIGIPASKGTPSNGISLAVLDNDGKQSPFLFLKTGDTGTLSGDKRKGII